MTWSCDWTGPAPAAPAAGHAPWAPAELDDVARGATTDVTDELLETLQAEELRADELRLAFEDGCAQGYQQGRAAEAQRIDRALATLEAIVLELEALREPWVSGAENHLNALATAIARHVIEREVRADANVITDLTRQALAEFPLNEPIRVRLNPEDLSALSVGERRLSPGRQVQWVADPGMTVGGCVVEGPRRIIDGRVEQVLERIYRALYRE